MYVFSISSPSSLIVLNPYIWIKRPVLILHLQRLIVCFYSHVVKQTRTCMQKRTHQCNVEVMQLFFFNYISYFLSSNNLLLEQYFFELSIWFDAIILSAAVLPGVVNKRACTLSPLRATGRSLQILSWQQGSSRLSWELLHLQLLRGQVWVLAASFLHTQSVIPDKLWRLWGCFSLHMDWRGNV